MKNVKIVRMISGEDVICDLVEDDSGTHMVDPLEIAIKFSKRNGNTIVLKNWLPIEIVGTNSARVNPRNIIAVVEVKEDVIEYYESTMTKIQSAIDKSNKIKDMNLDDEDVQEILMAMADIEHMTVH